MVIEMRSGWMLIYRSRECPLTGSYGMNLANFRSIANWRRYRRLLVATTFVAVSLTVTSLSAAVLNGHTVILDSSSKIIPWSPDPDRGYDTVVDLAWQFLLNNVPVETLPVANLLDYQEASGYVPISGLLPVACQNLYLQ